MGYAGILLLTLIGISSVLVPTVDASARSRRAFASMKSFRNRYENENNDDRYSNADRPRFWQIDPQDSLGEPGNGFLAQTLQKEGLTVFGNDVNNENGGDSDGAPDHKATGGTEGEENGYGNRWQEIDNRQPNIRPLQNRYSVLGDSGDGRRRKGDGINEGVVPGRYVGYDDSANTYIDGGGRKGLHWSGRTARDREVEYEANRPPLMDVFKQRIRGPPDDGGSNYGERSNDGKDKMFRSREKNPFLNLLHMGLRAPPTTQAPYEIARVVRQIGAITLTICHCEQEEIKVKWSFCADQYAKGCDEIDGGIMR